MAQGWRQDNPAESIAQALPKRDKSKKEHRKSLPFADVPAYIATVQASGADLSTKLTLDFLVLTATRSGETRGTMWSEIEWGTPATSASFATWTIPASRMKAK